MSSWRSALALAVSGDDQGEAVRLARSELANAERLGSRRLAGVALRTLGVLEGGQPEPTGSGVRAEDVDEDADEHESDLLDEGLEETFPASDPVSAKHIT